ncbi:hypothetical protein OTU49_012412, partial [Cherax quadricarinatus]
PRHCSQVYTAAFPLALQASLLPSHLPGHCWILTFQDTATVSSTRTLQDSYVPGHCFRLIYQDTAVFLPSRTLLPSHLPGHCCILTFQDTAAVSSNRKLLPSHLPGHCCLVVYQLPPSTFIYSEKSSDFLFTLEVTVPNSA